MMAVIITIPASISASFSVLVRSEIIGDDSDVVVAGGFFTVESETVQCVYNGVDEHVVAPSLVIGVFTHASRVVGNDLHPVYFSL